MKIKFSLFALLLICTSAICQTRITKKYESEELQDIRTIQIHLPTGYHKDTLTNYPLAIVLDGDYLFDLYVGNSKLFAHTDRAPKQIVVGIEMEASRVLDASTDPANGSLTADSNNFIAFIKEELLPYIEGNYKTSPFITIVGNGITANLITHFLKDVQPIFNAYLCLNPTFTKNINAQMQSYELDRLKEIDNTYYFYMTKNNHIDKEKYGSTDDLNTFLTSISADNFNIKYDLSEGSPGNVSAIGESVPRAFNKIFEIYSRISKEEYDSKIKDLSPADATAYLENKYIEIDYLFGANLGIREIDIIAIESLIIEKENGDYLNTFGRMIRNLYPLSPLGHYYLGLYYEKGKDYRNALEQYRLGYGKMDPSDPNADRFYQNVQRMLKQG